MKRAERKLKVGLKDEMRVIKQYKVFTNRLDAQLAQLEAVVASEDETLGQKLPVMMKIGDDVAAAADAVGSDAPPASVIMDVLDGLPLDTVDELRRLDDEVRTLGMSGEELYRHYVEKTASEVARFRRNFRCPEGKVLNRETGKCVKERVAKEGASRMSRVSASTREVKPCPEGKVRNPITGRCISDGKKARVQARSVRKTRVSSQSSAHSSTRAVVGVHTHKSRSSVSSSRRSSARL
jgi:hypothetical protein